MEYRHKGWVRSDYHGNKPGQAAGLVPRRPGFEAGWGEFSLPSLHTHKYIDEYARVKMKPRDANEVSI